MTVEIEPVDAYGFAHDLWGGRIRMDVLAFGLDLDDPAGQEELRLQVLMRLEEGLRIRASIEGRDPYPPNPPERKVRTIQLHVLFKDYRV